MPYWVKKVSVSSMNSVYQKNLPAQHHQVHVSDEAIGQGARAQPAICRAELACVLCRASLVLDQLISIDKQRTRINVEVGHVVPAQRLSVRVPHRAEHAVHYRACHQILDQCLQQGSTRMNIGQKQGPFDPACSPCTARLKPYTHHEYKPHTQAQASPPSVLKHDCGSLCGMGPTQDQPSRPRLGRHAAPWSLSQRGPYVMQEYMMVCTSR